MYRTILETKKFLKTYIPLSAWTNFESIIYFTLKQKWHVDDIFVKGCTHWRKLRRNDVSISVTTTRLSTAYYRSWWCHQMEVFSSLLVLCAGNSPVIGEFPAQRPVTRSFDAFFDLRLNKWLSKQSWGWWFETPSCSLWPHCNVYNSFRSLVFRLNCGFLKKHMHTK